MKTNNNETVVKTFGEQGSVKAEIKLREGQKGKFLFVDVYREYFDQAGTRHVAHTYNRRELDNLAAVVAEAQEFMRSANQPQNPAQRY